MSVTGSESPVNGGGTRPAPKSCPLCSPGRPCRRCNPGGLEHRINDGIAASQFNRRLWELVQLGTALQEKLGQFYDDFDDDSLTHELIESGAVTAEEARSAPGRGHIGSTQDVWYDVRGFLWVVQQGTSALEACVIEPSDDTNTAPEPIIVPKGGA